MSDCIISVYMYRGNANEPQTRYNTQRSIVIYTRDEAKHRIVPRQQQSRSDIVTPYFNRVYTELSNKTSWGINTRKQEIKGKRRTKSWSAMQTRDTHPPDKSPPSSCESSALELQRLLRQSRKVHLLVPVLWHVFAGSDAVDCHLWVEFEAAEKFGGDEEVLASAAAVFAGGGAGDVD